MLYTGGCPEPVLSKSESPRYEAFEGSNCSKTLCHCCGKDGFLKTSHNVGIAISPTLLIRFRTWGFAFFRFFISYFSCWIANRAKSGFHKLNKGVYWRHLGRWIMGPERFVSFIFFHSAFCSVLLGEILKNWYFFMKNYVWFWFSGEFWEKIIDYI